MPYATSSSGATSIGTVSITPTGVPDGTTVTIELDCTTTSTNGAASTVSQLVTPPGTLIMYGDSYFRPVGTGQAREAVQLSNAQSTWLFTPDGNGNFVINLAGTGLYLIATSGGSALHIDTFSQLWNVRPSSIQAGMSMLVNVDTKQTIGMDNGELNLVGSIIFLRLVALQPVAQPTVTFVISGSTSFTFALSASPSSSGASGSVSCTFAPLAGTGSSLFVGPPSFAGAYAPSLVLTIATPAVLAATLITASASTLHLTSSSSVTMIGTVTITPIGFAPAYALIQIVITARCTTSSSTGDGSTVTQASAGSVAVAGPLTMNAGSSGSFVLIASSSLTGAGGSVTCTISGITPDGSIIATTPPSFVFTTFTTPTGTFSLSSRVDTSTPTIVVGAITYATSASVPTKLTSIIVHPIGVNFGTLIIAITCTCTSGGANIVGSATASGSSAAAIILTAEAALAPIDPAGRTDIYSCTFDSLGGTNSAYFAAASAPTFPGGATTWSFNTATSIGTFTTLFVPAADRTSTSSPVITSSSGPTVIGTVTVMPSLIIPVYGAIVSPVVISVDCITTSSTGVSSSSVQQWSQPPAVRIFNYDINGGMLTCEPDPAIDNRRSCYFSRDWNANSKNQFIVKTLSSGWQTYNLIGTDLNLEILVTFIVFLGVRTANDDNVSQQWKLIDGTAHKSILKSSSGIALPSGISDRVSYFGANIVGISSPSYDDYHEFSSIFPSGASVINREINESSMLHVAGPLTVYGSSSGTITLIASSQPIGTVSSVRCTFGQVTGDGANAYVSSPTFAGADAPSLVFTTKTPVVGTLTVVASGVSSSYTTSSAATTIGTFSITPSLVPSGTTVSVAVNCVTTSTTGTASTVTQQSTPSSVLIQDGDSYLTSSGRVHESVSFSPRQPYGYQVWSIISDGSADGNFRINLVHTSMYLGVTNQNGHFYVFLTDLDTGDASQIWTYTTDSMLYNIAYSHAVYAFYGAVLVNPTMLPNTVMNGNTINIIPMDPVAGPLSIVVRGTASFTFTLVASPSLMGAAGSVSCAFALTGAGSPLFIPPSFAGDNGPNIVFTVSTPPTGTISTVSTVASSVTSSATGKVTIGTITLTPSSDVIAGSIVTVTLSCASIGSAAAVNAVSNDAAMISTLSITTPSVGVFTLYAASSAPGSIGTVQCTYSNLGGSGAGYFSTGPSSLPSFTLSTPQPGTFTSTITGDVASYSTSAAGATTIATMTITPMMVPDGTVIIVTLQCTTTSTNQIASTLTQISTTPAGISNVGPITIVSPASATFSISAGAAVAGSIGSVVCTFLLPTGTGSNWWLPSVLPTFANAASSITFIVATPKYKFALDMSQLTSTAVTTSASSPTSIGFISISTPSTSISDGTNNVQVAITCTSTNTRIQLSTRISATAADTAVKLYGGGDSALIEVRVASLGYGLSGTGSCTFVSTLGGGLSQQYDTTSLVFPMTMSNTIALTFNTPKATFTVSTLTSSSSRMSATNAYVTSLSAPSIIGTITVIAMGIPDAGSLTIGVTCVSVNKLVAVTANTVTIIGTGKSTRGSTSTNAPLITLTASSTDLGVSDMITCTIAVVSGTGNDVSEYDASTLVYTAGVAGGIVASVGTAASSFVFATATPVGTYSLSMSNALSVSGATSMATSAMKSIIIETITITPSAYSTFVSAAAAINLICVGLNTATVINTIITSPVANTPTSITISVAPTAWAYSDTLTCSFIAPSNVVTQYDWTTIVIGASHSFGVNIVTPPQSTFAVSTSSSASAILTATNAYVTSTSVPSTIGTVRVVALGAPDGGSLTIGLTCTSAANALTVTANSVTIQGTGGVTSSNAPLMTLTASSTDYGAADIVTCTFKSITGTAYEAFEYDATTLVFASGASGGIVGSVGTSASSFVFATATPAATLSLSLSNAASSIATTTSAIASTLIQTLTITPSGYSTSVSTSSAVNFECSGANIGTVVNINTVVKPLSPIVITVTVAATSYGYNDTVTCVFAAPVNVVTQYDWSTLAVGGSSHSFAINIATPKTTLSVSTSSVANMSATNAYVTSATASTVIGTITVIAMGIPDGGSLTIGVTCVSVNNVVAVTANTVSIIGTGVAQKSASTSSSVVAPASSTRAVAAPTIITLTSAMVDYGVGDSVTCTFNKIGGTASEIVEYDATTLKFTTMSVAGAIVGTIDTTSSSITFATFTPRMTFKMKSSTVATSTPFATSATTSTLLYTFTITPSGYAPSSPSSIVIYTFKCDSIAGYPSNYINITSATISSASPVNITISSSATPYNYTDAISCSVASASGAASTQYDIATLNFGSASILGIVTFACATPAIAIRGATLGAPAGYASASGESAIGELLGNAGSNGTDSTSGQTIQVYYPASSLQSLSGTTMSGLAFRLNVDNAPALTALTYASYTIDLQNSNMPLATFMHNTFAANNAADVNGVLPTRVMTSSLFTFAASSFPVNGITFGSYFYFDRPFTYAGYNLICTFRHSNVIGGIVAAPVVTPIVTISNHARRLLSLMTPNKMLLKSNATIGALGATNFAVDMSSSGAGLSGGVLTSHDSSATGLPMTTMLATPITKFSTSGTFVVSGVFAASYAISTIGVTHIANITVSTSGVSDSALGVTVSMNCTSSAGRISVSSNVVTLLIGSLTGVIVISASPSQYNSNDTISCVWNALSGSIPNEYDANSLVMPTNGASFGTIVPKAMITITNMPSATKYATSVTSASQSITLSVSAPIAAAGTLVIGMSCVSSGTASTMVVSADIIFRSTTASDRGVVLGSSSTQVISITPQQTAYGATGTVRCVFNNVSGSIATQYDATVLTTTVLAFTTTTPLKYEIASILVGTQSSTQLPLSVASIVANQPYTSLDVTSSIAAFSEWTYTYSYNALSSVGAITFAPIFDRGNMTINGVLLVKSGVASAYSIVAGANVFIISFVGTIPTQSYVYTINRAALRLPNQLSFALVPYAVLASTALTFAVPNVIITGNIGVSPYTSAGQYTGAPTVVSGSVILTSAAAATKAASLATLASALALPCTTILTELSGVTLGPGVYCSLSGTFNLAAAGTLTLVGLGVPIVGDHHPQFVFRTTTSIITGAGCAIRLQNGAINADVYFAIGSSITFGANNVMAGNFLASVSITVGASVSLSGRLFAGAAITFSSKATIDSTA